MNASAQQLIEDDPILREAFRYVVRVRAGRRFARLADIDFFQMPAVVPYLFTMDVVGSSPQRLQFKFTGTQVDAILDRNPINRYLDEIYSRPGHRIVKIYEEFLARQDIQISRATFTEEHGPARTITRMAIPLSDDGTVASHVIGAMVMRFASALTSTPPPPGQPSSIETFYIPSR